MRLPPAIRAVLDDLTDAEVLEVHKVVSRRAQPIYARIFRDNYDAGVAAARARAEREEHRES